MRVVTPDVSMWKYLTGFFDTLGGFQAAVLCACGFGVVTGALMWTGGASGGNAAIASRGRWAVAGACGCATAAVALPRLVSLVITTLS